MVLRGDIDRYGESAYVFIDSTDPPAERYKILHRGRTPFGLRSAYSSDGLSWSMCP